MLGLSKGEFYLAPYNKKWISIFNEEKERLNSLIGDYIVTVEHVGSTSLPIMAKPVIDIAIGMDNLAKVDSCVKALCNNPAYVYFGENGVPGRHLISKYNGEKGTHHLHFQLINSSNWQNQILFRDFLLDHPKHLKEYEELKKNLAKKSKTRLEYTNSKDAFIKQIIVLAKDGGYNASV